MFRRLIKSNPDDIRYYKELEKAMEITNDPKEKVELYTKCIQTYPRALLPKRLPMECTDGEEFLKHLKPYMVSAFTKGAPPLFTDLKSLYSCPKKVAAIEKLVTGMVDRLSNHGQFFEGMSYSFFCWQNGKTISFVSTLILLH